MSHKVAIIGAGYVGASIAYAALLRRLPATICLVDIDQKMVEGQVLDLNDAEFLSPTKIVPGTFKDAGQAEVIVITAGAKQKPGETRANLVDRNERIMRSIFREMKPLREDTIVIVVANPVEVLTCIAQGLSGLPRHQVLGSGTFLDSMRVRSMVSRQLRVNGNAIHCYVLGEHGDHQFISWSSARIGAAPLLSFPGASNLDLGSIQQTVAKKAYEIIDKKGATYYGIGACVASLLEAVLYDKKDVRCVSCWWDKYGVVVSAPAVVGRGGAEVLLELQLNEEDTGRLEKAVGVIREMCEKCSFDILD